MKDILEQREEDIKTYLVETIKSIYKVVDVVKDDSGYVEEAINKIFDSIKAIHAVENMNDNNISCFIIDDRQHSLLKHHLSYETTDIEVYNFILATTMASLAKTNHMHDIIPLASLLESNTLATVVKYLYRSSHITLVINTNSELITYQHAAGGKNEEKLSVFDSFNKFNSITVLTSSDYPMEDITSIILANDSFLPFRPTHEKLYIHLVALLSNLRKIKNNGNEIVKGNTVKTFITFYSIDTNAVLCGENIKNCVFLDGYTIDTKPTMEELYCTYSSLIKQLFNKVNKQEREKEVNVETDYVINFKGENISDILQNIDANKIKEGTMCASEMTSILPSNNYTSNKHKDTSSFIISDILEVKDIDKQIAATYMENKNVICIYSDKKEKSNSYEAILNTEIVNRNHQANGHGKLELYISGYGADKNEAIKDLDIVYNNIISQFNNLYKTK